MAVYGRTEHDSLLHQLLVYIPELNLEFLIHFLRNQRRRQSTALRNVGRSACSLLLQSNCTTKKQLWAICSFSFMVGTLGGLGEQ